MNLKNNIKTITIIFIIIYTINNFVYFLSKYIYKIPNYKYFKSTFLLLLIFPFFIYLVIIFIYKQQINISINYKKEIDSNIKSKLKYNTIFFFLIYLSGFIKSHYNYNYSEHLNFSNLIVLNFLLIIIIGPIFEEIIFRNIFLRSFLRRKKILIGIFFTSFLFSLGHFPLLYNVNTFNIIDFLDLFIFGVILALIRIFLGLKYSILAHTFRNTISVLANYGIINVFLIEYIQNKTVFYFSYYLSILIVIISIIYWLIYIKNHFQKSF
jgi:membrane protease YdiL (CAAX protease family)